MTPNETRARIYLSKCARAWWLTIEKHCARGKPFSEPTISEFGFVLLLCVFVSYVFVDNFAAISATCQRQRGSGNASFRFKHNIFCQLKWCT